MAQQPRWRERAPVIVAIVGALTTLGTSTPGIPRVADTASVAVGPGGSVHAVLRASATAVAQADLGLEIRVAASGPSSGTVSIVPDDAALDPFVLPRAADTSTGADLVGFSDLDAICPDEGDCEIGVTITVAAAEGPWMLAITAALLREGQRGCVGGDAMFEPAATVVLEVE